MYLFELGTLLRQARKAKKLTLKQVAQQAGVHFTTLSSLERGQVSDLGVRKLIRVAETLGLELELRPAGQRYTLDDVAKERANSPLLANQQRAMGEHANTFARALRQQSEGALTKVLSEHRPEGVLARLLREQEESALSANTRALSENSKGGLLARALRQQGEGTLTQALSKHSSERTRAGLSQGKKSSGR